MVKGFDKFKQYFAPHSDSFVVIGTQDIDILVIVEQMSESFTSAFHAFLREGRYDCYIAKEPDGSNKPRFYRFINPKNGRKVTMDFALEYYVRDGKLEFIGYSIFTTAHGVYRENILLSDSEIRARIEAESSPKAMAEKRSEVERFLLSEIVPHYHGPVGVDFVVDEKGGIHLCEMNLRHTMGMVAVSKLRVEN